MTNKPQASDTKTLQAIDTVDTTATVLDTKKDLGRPPMPDAIKDEVLERLAAGETLVAICRDEHMPTTTTVHRWLHEDSQFNASYMQARETQQHVWADECVAIADDGTTDYVIKTGRNGHEYEAVDQEHIQRSRLRVDTRLRLMAVVAPHIYGQKVEQVHSGTVDHKHDISSLTEREKMRRFALFMMEDSAQPVIEGELTNSAKHVSHDATMAKVSQSASIDKTDPDTSA